MLNNFLVLENQRLKMIVEDYLVESNRLYAKVLSDKNNLVSEPTDVLKNIIDLRISDEQQRLILLETKKQDALIAKVSEPTLRDQTIPNTKELPKKPIASTETITVDRHEWETLLASQHMLIALKTVGVIQWPGYKAALKLMNSGAKAA